VVPAVTVSLSLYELFLNKAELQVDSLCWQGFFVGVAMLYGIFLIAYDSLIDGLGSATKIMT